MTQPQLLRSFLPLSLLLHGILANANDQEEMVVVSAASAEIKVESTVLARVTQGQKLWGFKEQGGWFWVKVPGKEEKGWIHGSAVYPQRPTGARRQRLDEGLRAYESCQQLLLQGKNREALPYAEEYLNAMRESLGEHPNVANGMGVLASIHEKLGNYKQAEALNRGALEIQREFVGNNHVKTATSLGRLADLYSTMGRYKPSEELSLQSLAILRKLFGADHIKLAIPLGNLGLLYSDMGQYEQAEKMIRQSYEIQKKVLDEDDQSLAVSRNSLAAIYYRTAQFNRSKDLFLESLRIFRQKLGAEHPTTIAIMGNVAVVHQTLREFQQAEALQHRILELSRKIYGDRHTQTALNLSNLAALYVDMGRRSEGVPLLLEAVEINKQTVGKDHPRTATSQANLASFYKDLGQIDKAESLYRQALETRISSLGEDHPDTAVNLFNLADVVGQKGDSEAAVEMYKRSLTICRQKLVSDHPLTLRVLNGLAVQYGAIGRRDDTRSLYEESLVISRKVNGDDHPDTAIIMSNLAWRHAALGDFPKADELFEKAIATFRDQPSIDTRQLGFSHAGWALSYAAQEKWTDAAREYNANQRASRYEVAHVLPGLPTSDQLTFLWMNHRSWLDQSLTLGLQQSQDQHLVDLSAEWLLNGKALTGEVLAERTRSARQSTDPAVREQLRKLLTVQSQLAAISMKVPNQSQRQSYKDTLIQLTERESRLARELGIAVKDDDQSEPWISLNELRARIPQRAVLVDLLQISPFDFSECYNHSQEPQPSRYVAWVIPPAGNQKVQIVDLGPADEINAKIKSARGTIAVGSRKLRELGEVESEKAARTELSTLAEKILQPLLTAAGDVEQLILSPDAGLWLVPWSALPVDEDHYAVEKYLITYIVSSRELVEDQDDSPESDGPPVVFADPDYDRRLTADKEAQKVSSLTSLISGVGRLPGTAAEAKAITPGLQKLTGQKPQVWLEAKATEATVKKTSNAPVVVLSTHGFFLKDEKLPHLHGRNVLLASRGLSKVRPQPKESQKLDWNRMSNPLLRCGLLFAGCNQKNIPLTGAGNDGVLTGMEILGTDLRGTELVVLSACQTGLGDMRSGEGVAGLRQAFRLAGAKSVASTLWSIPDQATAFLMSDFFQNLAKDMGRSAALQRAQQSQIQARRKQHKAAHPFYWAAFTLTGISGD